MLGKHVSLFFCLYLFFFATFIADAAITTYYVSTLNGVEGNPIVVWLWDLFGQDSFPLKIVYLGFVWVLTYLLTKFNKFLGVSLLLSFGIGHLLGFLTWVSPLRLATLELLLLALIISVATTTFFRREVKI